MKEPSVQREQPVMSLALTGPVTGLTTVTAVFGLKQIAFNMNPVI